MAEIDWKQRYLDQLRQTIEEVNYALKTTNLPYWGRRLKELRDQLANETKNR